MTSVFLRLVQLEKAGKLTTDEVDELVRLGEQATDRVERRDVG